MDFNVGNIVLYNSKNYLILDKNKEELLCIPIKDIEMKRIINYIDFNNVDFGNSVTIDNKEKIEYITNTTPDVVLFLLKKYKNFIIDSKIKNNPQIGSIIAKNNKYYYIFSEESQRWLVFELSKNELKDSDVFTLGNGIYYTNYFQTVINKIDVFETIYQCKEGQIELLRRRRRAYQKLICENLPNSTESVVKLDQLSDEKYIVKTNIGDKLICVSNYDKKHIDNRKHFFDKEDVVFIKIKQKRR